MKRSFFNRQSAAVTLLYSPASLAEAVGTARAAEICTSRKTRVMSYLTRSEAWGAWPHELLAIALWYSGDRAGAAKAHAEAKAINPDDPIVKGNERWFAAP